MQGTQVVDKEQQPQLLDVRTACSGGRKSAKGLPSPERGGGGRHARGAGGLVRRRRRAGAGARGT
eukprot:1367619-Pyramimonas_sp.AAC.2